jgi:hypothetical protein
MSLGGPPPSFILIFGGFVCIILGFPVAMVLGISQTIPTIIGVIIMLVGAPVTLHMERNRFGAMPPCFLFGFTGFAILFAGLFVSSPFGDATLAPLLIVIGILQAVLGIPLATLYLKRVNDRTTPLWPRSVQSKMDQMEKMMQDQVESRPYEEPRREERVVVREVLVKQKIPLECKNCGAPINPEEVDWIGPDAIKCPNCGHSLGVETERI